MDWFRSIHQRWEAIRHRQNHRFVRGHELGNVFDFRLSKGRDLLFLNPSEVGLLGHATQIQQIRCGATYDFAFGLGVLHF